MEYAYFIKMSHVLCIVRFVLIEGCNAFMFVEEETWPVDGELTWSQRELLLVALNFEIFMKFIVITKRL